MLKCKYRYCIDKVKNRWSYDGRERRYVYLHKTYR
jgi:hypothetical protein